MELSLFPIDDDYRNKIHSYGLTCTFTCAVGKRTDDSKLEILSSNLDHNVFSNDEQQAIIEANENIIIIRGNTTLSYNLVRNEGEHRIYRCESLFADFVPKK